MLENTLLMYVEFVSKHVSENDELYPEILRDIKNKPEKLYYKGKWRPTFCKQSGRGGKQKSV